MMIHHADGETFEHGAVIFALDSVGHQLARILQAPGAGFMIEDGAVEILLGGKVAEDHSFRDSGRPGNFLGSSAAKALLREQTHGHQQELQPPLFARHTPAQGNVRAYRRLIYLFAQTGKVPRRLMKVSAYLPPFRKGCQAELSGRLEYRLQSGFSQTTEQARLKSVL